MTDISAREAKETLTRRVDAFEARLRSAELMAHRATVVSAVLAALAVVGATWQIGEARKIQREATAYEVYDEYLRVAVEHPHMSCPSPEDLEAILADPMERERYNILLALALNAGEQILEARPRSPAWRETVSVTVRCHEASLRGWWFESGGHRNYACSLRSFIGETLSDRRFTCPRGTLPG
jgi:hypothetical protein